MLIGELLLETRLNHAVQSYTVTFPPSPTSVALEMRVFAGLERLRAETADFYRQLGQISPVLTHCRHKNSNNLQLFSLSNFFF